LRLKIPSRKGDAAFFSNLKERLAGLDGIRQLDVNPLTGSVLIIHTLEPAVISRFAERNALFTVSPASREPRHVFRAIEDSFREYDQKLKRFTNNELDIPVAAFATLVGLGLAQIARGNFGAPAWYIAFWYALDLFRGTRSLGMDGAPAAGRGTTRRGTSRKEPPLDKRDKDKIGSER
jgi:hypothetical protein